jgi:hypothetical protein
MTKLIGLPLMLLLLPQLVLGVFFLLAGAVLGGSWGLSLAYVITAGIVLFVCGIATITNLCKDWIPDYIDEQRRLYERRELERAELRKQIDAEIGLPRVGRRP